MPAGASAGTHLPASPHAPPKPDLEPPVANALFKMLGPAYESAVVAAQERYLAEAQAALAGMPGMRVDAVPLHVCHCLPWLFADVLPGATEAQRVLVAAAGLLYQGHVLILDQVVDGDAAVSGARLLKGSFLHERALTILAPHLPPDTPAWEHLAGCVREYAGAVLLEKAHHGQLRPFPRARFDGIAAGKGAILKASPAMLACMTGRPELVAELHAVIAPHSIAVQVQDDLQDWRPDFRAGLYSHLLMRALDAAGHDIAAGGALPSEEEVGQALFYSGCAEEILAYAVDCCTRSSDRARALGAGEWARFNDLFRDRLGEIAAGFARLRRRGLAVAAAQTPRVAHLDAAFDRLGESLAGQHAAGYREARHVMGFSHEQGFTGDSDVHAGLVFQRAVVGWLYARMEEAGRPVAAGVVDENLRALRDLRPAGERGGWSYFPTLPELAPDSDDLAQVIHAFAARPLDDEAWDALFGEPVRLVLDHHRHEDGAVDTWIVDPAAPLERQERYRRYAERCWGRDVDPEVVANFFSALHDRDPVRYADAVRAGAAYVAARQREDGGWTSTWYVGPYYGTFAATRLLRQTDPDHPALRRALDFLRRTQRADGGWGVDGKSDALSTALALLAWTEAGGADNGTRRMGEDAVRHLLAAQRDDGLWPRSDFIRMNLNRATPGAPERIVTYGSATMAAAFAGAALLRAGRVLETA